MGQDRPEPIVTKISGTECDWAMTDKYDELYPYGIKARRRVSGAGELLDGDYCARHATMAVEWWRQDSEVLA